MADVSDQVARCLAMTEGDARQQWRRIAGRRERPRQEAFLPVELVLCFGLFRTLNPHRFGGRNMHQLPVEVAALARTFKRPPGSLTNKMLNLEGFRANGARHETELYLRLGQEADRFAALYVTVLRAARLEGLGEAAVPDFLGWLAVAPEPALLGQEEIGAREVDLVLAASVEEVRAIEGVYGFGERETSRIVEQRVRLGQHCFASQVLAEYQHRCAFCGLDAAGLRGHRLLVASHIKPWAASDNRERLDPRNGLSACSIHDSAFDTGLLTVRTNLAIRRARVLEERIAEDEVADRLFGRETVGERLFVPPGATGPRGGFLEYHGCEVFRG